MLNRVCGTAFKREAHALRERPRLLRTFHASSRLAIIRPFLLSDPGEGIKEVQIIQWFVEPGARVEQFSPICEVQSDKSIAEVRMWPSNKLVPAQCLQQITSRFDGVIKKLHYEQDDVVQVGQALLDIDVQSDVAPQEEAITAPEPQQAGNSSSPQQPQKNKEIKTQTSDATVSGEEERGSSKKHAGLATPAVRGLLKELNIDIGKVTGTGVDGRVTKEDIHKYVADQKGATSSAADAQTSDPNIDVAQKERRITLTPVQSQMFKVMTRSLQIPHFVFADEVNVTAISGLRQRLNVSPSDNQKLSYLHFIVKAVSLALRHFPLLNSRVEAGDENDRPQLVMREYHNIGIAMDTPQGLLVPNIKNVASRSMLDIASECYRLQSLAKEGKLSSNDLTAGTITVSNIGSIGGTYVAPVIVQSEVAILGLGKAKTVPAFDDQDRVVKKDVMNFSWSADHRVVDGATMARMQAQVATYLEEPASMLSVLR